MLKSRLLIAALLVLTALLASACDDGDGKDPGDNGDTDAVEQDGESDLDTDVPGDTDVANDSQTDGDTPGCADGYELQSGDCVDIDGCADDPCAQDVICNDVPAPGTGFVCGECPPGFFGNGVTCTQQVDCSNDPSICDSRATCEDTGDGTLRCVCPSPFNGDGATCNRPVGFGILAADLTATLEDAALGDLNGDGWPDVVGVNDSIENLFVSMSNGNLGFDGPTEAVLLGEVDRAHAVVTGDFDLDGNVDVAVANHINPIGTGGIGGTVGISPGDGTGALATPEQQVQVLDQPDMLLAADFTGDGALDILVGSAQRETIGIMLNDGAGTFTWTLLEGPTNTFSDMVAGDFGGDDSLDFAIVIDDGTFNDGLLTIYIGDGSGGFTAQPNILIDSTPVEVVSADFDGQNGPDFAISHLGSADVTFLLADGMDGYAIGDPLTAADDAGSLAAGDFNEDGRPDLAVSARRGVNDYLLEMYLNDGNGSFTRSLSFPTDDPRNFEILDYDGDGHLDLAFLVWEQMAFAFGDGTGQLELPAVTGFPMEEPNEVTAGDFNEDGLADLAFMASQSSTVAIYPGNGDGTWQASTESVTFPEARDLVVEDLDLDGHLDLIGVGSGFRFALSPGDGTFSTVQERSIGCDTATSSGLADFELRQLASSSAPGLDLLAFCAGIPAMMTVVHEIASQTPDTPIASEDQGTGPRTIAADDFDGDGSLDVVLSYYNTSVIPVLTGDDAGNFTRSNTLDVPTFGVMRAVGDLDGNGVRDLIVAAPDGGSLEGNTRLGTIEVYLADGQGGFAHADTHLVGMDPGDAYTIDADGDGRLDVVVVNPDSNMVSLLMGDGTGTLAPPRHYLAGERPVSLAVGDVDGDGRLDLMTADDRSRTVTTMLNR